MRPTEASHELLKPAPSARSVPTLPPSLERTCAHRQDPDRLSGRITPASPNTSRCPALENLEPSRDVALIARKCLGKVPDALCRSAAVAVVLVLAFAGALPDTHWRMTVPTADTNASAAEGPD